MNFKPDEKNIRSLLKSSCQFIIPRFQREYSWDKKNYQEFFEDMINNLVVDEGNIKDDQYFLGTMLFVGNFTEKPDKPIEVIDGQQRLTTITILFSVLSDRFRELGEETLSKQLFNYIMTTDDDGNKVRVLQSKSSYPYFVYYIQDREKTINTSPNTEEENCIKETYEYFLQQTSENALKKLLKKRMGDDTVQSFSHIEILKALRDQVLVWLHFSDITGYLNIDVVMQVCYTIVLIKQLQRKKINIRSFCKISLIMPRIMLK